MPTPSKFTADRRQKIVQALKIGASRRTAAAVAGVDESTLRDWLARGKDAEEGSRWREFYEDCEDAVAHPKMRALGLIYEKLGDDANIAWKFIERREEGYAPPQAGPPQAPAGPVVIALAFHDGEPVESRAGTVIDVGEVRDGEQALPDPATG